MRGRQMITTRAHRHQASPNLLVCLRSRSVPLGTVEIRCLQHRLTGRYRPFPPNFALFANWLSVPHAGVGTPPHANFIVNYPIFFMKPFIPPGLDVHGEFGVLPMFDLLLFGISPIKSVDCNLKRGWWRCSAVLPVAGRHLLGLTHSLACMPATRPKQLRTARNCNRRGRWETWV